MKKYDKILLLSLIPFFIFSIFYFNINSDKKYLTIINREGEKNYSLLENKIVNVKGDLGDLKVEINNGKARVIESNCKEKLCIKRGWISIIGEYSACLPNDVFIIINGRSEIDGISE
ncbi:MAG TPA: NusG domain II-containing protein [Caldisericia bacterium]|nr:NusG domain II-containing protein [Caldisericia bacterium]HOL82437.1 NusG domain II-containing protein [Caldisericia bacterium]HPC57013.1 NusG domain II-containing protein [Caldisericia bacterium]HPP43184.1 NusG domain II-containing protein [Caldisericia bacterium]HRT37397.1 NusG domain II-containing protein [Caldisericia bacterium]